MLQREANAKTFHQAAGQQFSTQTRGNGVSMPVAAAQRGGMRAERARNSMQQRHIHMTGLETCDGLNVHQGMGDDHIELVSRWTHESNGLMDKSSTWGGTQRKEKAMARWHGRDFSTTGNSSMPIQRSAHAAKSPGGHSAHAATRRHSPHVRRLDATVPHVISDFAGLKDTLV